MRVALLFPPIHLFFSFLYTIRYQLLSILTEVTDNLIILPQSFKRIVPPLANEFIVLIKDSSLVSTIGVYDLMQTSNILGGRYYNYFLPMIAAAIVYLVLTLVISHYTTKLEERLAASD